MILELLVLAHLRATHYGPGTGRDSDGSSYSSYHCASADYPLGTVLNVTYREEVKVGRHTRVRVHRLRHIPVRDKCGIPGRIDLPSRYGGIFGPRGWRDQPRGGFPIEVTKVGFHREHSRRTRHR